MDFIGADYQAKQIKKYQKFLLKLLHFHIGNYYPLRKYLGISHKGKINEITNLSIAYNAKKVKKGYQVTRTYQQPDLGYKLNLILDKIPQLALLPALLQPSYGLAALAFFFLTQTTYQPSSKDTELSQEAPTTNFGTNNYLIIGYQANITKYFNSILDFDLTDIPDGAVFSQGDILEYSIGGGYNANTSRIIKASRITQLGWVEAQATWNVYSTGNDWATAGGDYTTTNEASYEGTISFPAWWTISSSALIQDCWNNQSKHINIILRQPATTNCYAYFFSREYTTDTSLRPKLTVTYTVGGGANTTNFFQFFN